MGAGESKIQLRENVLGLLIKEVPVVDVDFWQSFFEFNGTADDLFDVLTLEDIVQLLQNQPQNIKSLIVHSTAVIENIANRKPLGNREEDHVDVKPLLNAVRLLTRVIPTIQAVTLPNSRLSLPPPDDSKEYSHATRDKKKEKEIGSHRKPEEVDGSGEHTSGGEDRGPPPDSDTGYRADVEMRPGRAARVERERQKEMLVTRPPPETVDSPEAAGAAPEVAAAAATAAQPEAVQPVSARFPNLELFWGISGATSNEFAEIDQTAYGPRIVKALMQILFFPTVSIAYRDYGKPPAIADLLWEPGLGANEVERSPGGALEVRLAVLKCLLALCAGDCYLHPDNLVATSPSYVRNLWLECATDPDLPYTKELLYSIVNLACAYNPSEWKIPYAGKFTKDETGEVLRVGLQFLCGVLGHAPIKPLKPNAYYSHVQQIKDPEDFSHIVYGFTSLLINPVQVKQTLLPGSMTEAVMTPEVLVTLWYLLQFNSGLLMQIVSSAEAITALVEGLMFKAYTDKDFPDREANTKLIVYVLLLLSAERNFGVSVNRHLERDVKLPDLPHLRAGEQSYADYLVLVVLKLAYHFIHCNDSLGEVLIVILSNLSPYIRELCQPAASKFVDVIVTLSSEKYMQTHPQVLRILYYLILYINNALQYQFQGNSGLFYSVLRSANAFSVLSKLKRTAALQGTDEAEEAQGMEKRLAVDSMHLPLMPIETLISTMRAHVSQMCENNVALKEILNFIRDSTLVGILPQPHRIMPQLFRRNVQTDVWIKAYLWSMVFTQHCLESPRRLLSTEHVVLFELTDVGGVGSESGGGDHHHGHGHSDSDDSALSDHGEELKHGENGFLSDFEDYVEDKMGKKNATEEQGPGNEDNRDEEKKAAPL